MFHLLCCLFLTNVVCFSGLLDVRRFAMHVLELFVLIEETNTFNNSYATDHILSGLVKWSFG